MTCLMMWYSSLIPFPPEQYRGCLKVQILEDVTEHITTLPSDGEGLAAVVPLENGDHLRDELALLLQTTQLQAGLQAQADLRHGVRQLLLDQLVGAERST